MNNSTVVTAKQGMVASSQPLATEIGVDILQQGGSAVDAAIATNAALGLMEPHMCGIGGDLFAIAWDENSGQLHGLNASGRSPAGLAYAELKQRLHDEELQAIPVEGLLPVSVPGATDGWFELHQRFGRLPMQVLLEPSIHHAENGFSVTPVIAGEWQEYSLREGDIARGDFELLYRPGSKAPAQGDSFKNLQLANAYRLIAKEGRAGFYAGELAESIAAFMRDHGGYLDREDLSRHHSDWVKPLSVKYRGHDIVELPPNGQGLAALQMLRLLEPFDLQSFDALSAESIHLMVEAKKLAFEDRARFYADPDTSPAPVDALLSDQYSALRRQLISDQAARKVVAGDPLLRQGDTVYLTAADAEGNMVSLIQSIFHPFGSGVVVPGTGFALQNRGLLFSMDPAHANVYAPGKRPFQTIIPAFVMRDGKPLMSFGVMGGDMQPQGHVQVISNLLDFNMNLQEAGNAPRWRHDGSTSPTARVGDVLEDGGRLIMEAGNSEATIAELIKRGHVIAEDERGFGFGGYQAIMRDRNGGYLGASECRKDGYALGY